MRMRVAPTSQVIKACCASVYASDWARLLIGDSMHPGGVELTERLGHLLELGPGSRVVDVAAGRGVSALTLAQRFGCEVVGIDLSQANVERARAEADRSGLAGLVSFDVGDAEVLPLADAEFDAVICECAFCTFPDKARAASEFARVLKPGGQLGLSDLVLRVDLPRELHSLAGWVACIADARPESEYIRYLELAGFAQARVEVHDQELADLARQIRLRLLTATVANRLGQLEMTGIDLYAASALAQSAELAIRDGLLGYVALTATRLPAVRSC
jgi:arsenite methyltransferase